MLLAAAPPARSRRAEENGVLTLQQAQQLLQIQSWGRELSIWEENWTRQGQKMKDLYY
jgi:hypothetical protein